MPKKPSKGTTSATKHKLPLPKGHPQVKAKPKKRKPVKRVLCQWCEKRVPVDGIHSCYDAKQLREMTEREKVWADRQMLKDVPPRAIPCGEDLYAPAKVTPHGDGSQDVESPHIRVTRISLPPDTSSYPCDWRIIGGGVAVLSYVDDAIRATRKYVGARLSRLAQWVTPK